MKILHACSCVIVMWLAMAFLSEEQELLNMSNEFFWFITAIVYAGGLAGGK